MNHATEQAVVSELPKKQNGGLTSIDIAQVQYFLVATEQLNYTRAAAALGISSSTISRQIRRIEDHIGVSLFERHRNGITLTAAGRRFHAGAQQFMFEFGRAVDNAARAGRAEIGDLHLGVGPSILAGPLQEFLHLYRNVLPEVEVRCLEGEHTALLLALREHRVDVAAGYPDLGGNAGIRVMHLWREQLYVGLPEQHALASRRFVTWKQFENQNVVIRGWTTPPQAYKELARRLPKNMKIMHHLVSSETLLGLVAAGFGFTVLPQSSTKATYPGVVFRPIKELDAMVVVFAAWLDETDNPAKVKFLAELRAFAARNSGNGNREL